jgi:hypothetical protein
LDEVLVPEYSKVPLVELAPRVIAVDVPPSPKLLAEPKFPKVDPMTRPLGMWRVSNPFVPPKVTTELLVTCTRGLLIVTNDPRVDEPCKSRAPLPWISSVFKPVVIEPPRRVPLLVVVPLFRFHV